MKDFKKILNLIFKAQEFQFKQKNLRSATTHEKALLEQINKEIDLGGNSWVFFTEKPISNLRLNPVGVVLKSNAGWRLISHLSSPLGESVNDFIDPNLCSVSYSRFEDVIKKSKN